MQLKSLGEVDASPRVQLRKAGWNKNSRKPFQDVNNNQPFTDRGRTTHRTPNCNTSRVDDGSPPLKYPSSSTSPPPQSPLRGHQPATLPLIGVKSRCRRSLYHHPLATQMAKSTPRVAHLHCVMHDHENISRATAIMRYPPLLNGMVLLRLLMLNNSPLPSSQLHSNHFGGSTIRCRLGVQKLTTTSMISANLSSSPVVSSLQWSVPKMLCPIQKHRSSGAVRYGRVPARK